VEWILLGCIPIAVYYLIAYKLTHHQRHMLVTWFFTAVVVFAVAGIVYEVVTTGTFAVTPTPD
jgi:Na+/melibiose symporter-like transporter